MKKTQRGFTMIELIIAMGAVSVLLVVIAVLVYNITRIYTKGVTIRNVNTAGRLIIDDMKRAISGSPTVKGIFYVGSNLELDEIPSKIQGADGQSVTYYAGGTVLPDGTFENASDPFFAPGPNPQIIDDKMYLTRFCTGSYSYIWNLPDRSNNGKTFLGQLRVENQYQSDPNKPVRLVKIKDLTREYCKDSTKKIDDTNPDNKPTELLPDDETSIVVYDFQPYTPVTSITTGEVYYNIEFVLGTLRGAEVTAGTAGRTCKAPNSDENDFDYCSINKFNMSARATGKNE